MSQIIKQPVTASFLCPKVLLYFVVFNSLYNFWLFEVVLSENLISVGRPMRYQKHERNVIGDIVFANKDITFIAQKFFITSQIIV